ncbi:MAG: hypothetical protein AB8B83_06600 [Bdellovibrionales bacterium]
MKQFLYLCVCLSFLSACERPVGKARHGLPMPQQTFTHFDTISVNVGSILIDDTGIIGRGGVSDELLSHARSYLGHKIQRANGKGQLVVRVENASSSYVLTPSKYEMLENFALGQVQQETLKLQLRIEHLDDYGNVLHGRVLSAQKVINISEHASVSERDQKRFNAIDDIFKTIDPEMNRIIASEMHF